MRPFLPLLLAALLLTACGRPLTEGEKRVIFDTHGDTIDTSKVRLRKGNALSLYKFTFPIRPREACQELIFPPYPEGTETVSGSPGALVLFNHVFLGKDLQLKDFAPEYPKRVNLIALMIFAHELTHIWQWQNRDKTDYHPFKAAAEHQFSDDPYLFDLKTEVDFLSLGYEQQGAAMEEFICCTALAPEAARTKRLKRMLGEYFPVERLARLTEADILLPWDGVVTKGICD